MRLRATSGSHARACGRCFSLRNRPGEQLTAPMRRRNALTIVSTKAGRAVARGRTPAHSAHSTGSSEASRRSASFERLRESMFSGFTGGYTVLTWTTCLSIPAIAGSTFKHELEAHPPVARLQAEFGDDVGSHRLCRYMKTSWNASPLGFLPQFDDVVRIARFSTPR